MWIYYKLRLLITSLTKLLILIFSESAILFEILNNHSWPLHEQEIDKLVAEVIRYILFKTHQNSGCPIKRDELVQLITKNYHQRSLPSYIINEARMRLSTIFGCEVTELQRSSPSSTNKTRASQQSTAE